MLRLRAGLSGNDEVFRAGNCISVSGIDEESWLGSCTSGF